VSALLDAVREALAEADPWRKCQLVAALQQHRGEVSTLQQGDANPPVAPEPGRPEKPLLVHPRELPRRGLGTPEGRAALIHAVAHIEFNAINLALDALCRFTGMPPEYYRDWLQVAEDEARHFNEINKRLKKLNYKYGDFPAHRGLWDMAMRTAHDPLHRMALIPRVMEARGLDVTPGMIRRFRTIGDHETVAVLALILHEEVAHVAAGSRWFRYLCKQRGLPAEATYLGLVQRYMGGKLHCPLSREARLQAFRDTRDELSRRLSLLLGPPEGATR
jgi:uncharacterized ferritin-like protein (DUF455 family)